MNIALRRAMTVPEYLAWAEARTDDLRTELINGQIVAMSPERIAHNRAKIRLLMALHRAISAAGISGEALTDGVTVPIDNFTAYEPDALVYCGDPLPGNEMTVTNPVVVFEILSPTTAHTDTSAKLIGYFKLASVQHYLIIDLDRRTISHHARASDGSVAARRLTAGTLHLDPPGIDIEVTDLIG